MGIGGKNFRKVIELNFKASVFYTTKTKKPRIGLEYNNTVFFAKEISVLAV